MLAIDGDREAGEDVRTQNVTAAMAIANVVKTSFGPVGLDKMLVDDIGDVLVTNDGATILAQLEVEHPAAKVLVELAGLQDREVGDGTTSVVILAAELLRRGNDLVKRKIHPTCVISGYRLAAQEACRYIHDNLAIRIDALPKDTLMNVAKTALSSKVLGNEDSDFFARLAVDALTRVRTVDSKGDAKYPVKAVNILKAHGRSARESVLVQGYALNCTAASQAMPKKVTGCKIACLDMNLTRERMALTVQVLVSDPTKLEAIRKREEDIAKERVQTVLKSGANVILTSKGIDDMCLKYFVEAGAIAVRRVAKDDLRRIAKATGATVALTFAALEGEDTFDPSNLGHCDEVVQERVADDECLIFRGAKLRAASLILRGASSFLLDEMERSLHDALCIVKRTLESSSVVAGGGAVDASLSVYLDSFARTLGTREQLAVREFAEALLVIPKTLAINAAQDALDLTAKLRAYHHSAQTGGKEQQHFAHYGLDLIAGVVRDNLAAGVLEPAVCKTKIIKFASEAAIDILRIDEVVRLAPRPQGRPGGPED